MNHCDQIHATRRKAETTAELKAEVATGELSGRMLELARAVTEAPQDFTIHHAHKLRNACNVALGAADLIELEHTK